MLRALLVVLDSGVVLAQHLARPAVTLPTALLVAQLTTPLSCYLGIIVAASAPRSFVLSVLFASVV
jgi:hypothetical protein